MALWTGKVPLATKRKLIIIINMQIELRVLKYQFESGRLIIFFIISNSCEETALLCKVFDNNLLTVSRLVMASVMISWCFLIFVLSFLLATINPEETRAKQPQTLPNGTVAGRPTTEIVEPKLAVENVAERTLGPAALQYFFDQSIDPLQREIFRLGRKLWIERLFRKKAARLQTT